MHISGGGRMTQEHATRLFLSSFFRVLLGTTLRSQAISGPLDGTRLQKPCLPSVQI